VQRSTTGDGADDHQEEMAKEARDTIATMRVGDDLEKKATTQ
jgi:hypothetical protein